MCTSTRNNKQVDRSLKIRKVESNVKAAKSAKNSTSSASKGYYPANRT
ncbi:hypothetical protein RHO12_03310 [Orbus sturtevantii]